MDLEFLTQQNDIQEREIGMLNQNISKMKSIKTSLDDNFLQEKTKVQKLLGSVASKDDMIQELEKCLSHLQSRMNAISAELIE